MSAAACGRPSKLGCGTQAAVRRRFTTPCSRLPACLFACLLVLPHAHTQPGSSGLPQLMRTISKVETTRFVLFVVWRASWSMCSLGGANPKYLTPSEVMEVMRRTWELNEPILAFIYPAGG